MVTDCRLELSKIVFFFFFTKVFTHTYTHNTLCCTYCLLSLLPFSFSRTYYYNYKNFWRLLFVHRVLVIFRIRFRKDSNSFLYYKISFNTLLIVLLYNFFSPSRSTGLSSEMSSRGKVPVVKLSINVFWPWKYSRFSIHLWVDWTKT